MEQQHNVLVIQRRGRAVTDYKYRRQLQLMSIRKISTKSMGQVISTLFKSQEKFVQ